MKRKTLLFALLLFLFLTNLSLSQNESILNLGESHTFDSKVMSEKRTIIVHLPSGYEKTKVSYPVLYITDGEIHTTHTRGTVDYLAKFRLIPEMIVVGVVNTDRDRDLRPTPIDKQEDGVIKGADRFLKFFSDEVIPMIDKKYRTLPYKVFSGTSYGGLFGINALLTKPKIFDATVAISPSLYWDNQSMQKKANILFSEKKIKGNLYITIANEQPIMIDSFNDFLTLLKNNPSNEVKWASKVFKQETHNTTVLIGQYYAFKEIFKEWNIPEGEPQNLTQLLTRYSKMSKQLGTEIILPEDRVNGYGTWLMYLNRLDEANELFRWNTLNYPKSSNAFNMVGQINEKLGKYNEAKKNYENALRITKKINPSESESIITNLNRVTDIIDKRNN
jgi:predicted alpha/beta superfamily hydrolase